MSFTLLSVVIIAMAVIIVYRQMRKGYKHGLSRSLIHLATLLCCAIFSAPISALLAKLLVRFLLSLLEGIGWLDFLSGSLSALTLVVELMMSMILAVLLYLPVFFIFKFLLRMLLRFLNAVLRVKRVKKVKKNLPEYCSEELPFYLRHDRKLGAGIGAFSGIILVIVIFMPLMGILKTADDIVDTLAEISYVETINKSSSAKLLNTYANDAAGTVLHASGGRVLYDLTAQVYYKGYSTTMNKEIEAVRSLHVVDSFNEIRSHGKIDSTTIELICGILDDLHRSLFLRIVVSDFLGDASQQWLQYEEFLGIERPDIGGYGAVNDLFDSILFVCSSTTLETYEADFKTILGVFGILTEYTDTFESDDYQTFMTEFVEGDALDRIENELKKNPRMSMLDTSIDGLLMDVIATELSSLPLDIEGSHGVYSSIADALNSSRNLEGSVKKTAVSNAVADSFAEQGVYLPPVMEDRIASILMENIPTDGYITEERLKDYFEGHMSETEAE